MTTENYLFALFGAIIIGFLIVDLGFFEKKAHKVGFKSALIQSIAWISIALVFGGLIFLFDDPIVATEFFSAYITEKMLSVDNLFVFLLIFDFFKLDEKYHHKVLFWGILGAIVFRGIFIGAGSLLIQQFSWLLYIFGAILLYTGAKLFFDKKEKHMDFGHNKAFKLAKRVFRLSESPHEGKFFVKEHGKWHVTILFMILLIVETTDIIFAFDSIPAAFSISQRPFVIFTSNIFAIMGLRALFFLVENILHKFHHLQKGLSFILIFIGLKMLIGIFGVHISSIISFVIILIALGLALLLSVLFPKKI